MPKLGPGVTGYPVEIAPEFRPPFEGISEGEATRSDYILSKKQRELLISGDVKSRSEVNKEALKKRDRLPDRIQHFMDDVALLYTSRSLTKDIWEKGLVEPKTESSWAKFHRQIRSSDDGEIVLPSGEDDDEEKYYNSPFESPSDFWSGFVDVDPTNWKFRNDVFMMNDPVLSREVLLGFEIGSMLRMLKPDIEEEIPGADLIWGFTLAFIGQPKDDVRDSEQNQLERLVDDFDSRQQSRQEEVEMVKDFESPDGSQTPDDDLTKQGIQDAGITPHQVVVEEVSFHQPTTPNDGDLHRRNAKKVTKDISSIVPLREVDELAQMVDVDLDTIERKGASGIKSASSVLKQMWEMETSSHEDLTSSNVGAEIGESESSVTALLNLLSTKEDYKSLCESPLVKEFDHSKERGREWTITPYGMVVARTAFERDGDISWLYRFAIGPEEISLQERKFIIEVLDDFDQVE